VNLNAEKEPEIFNAVRYGSVLENVLYKPGTNNVDYSNISITENTRCCYPLEYM
jgi:phosphoenolpyruvate carboxykinase (ATP)